MVILFGLIVASFGLYRLWRSIHLRIKGRATIGTVTNVKMGGRRTPIFYVSFKNSKGRTIVFNAGGWRVNNISPSYQKGSPVPVLYDPNNSRKAMIDTIDFVYSLPLTVICMGLLIIYLGFTH